MILPVVDANDIRFTRVSFGKGPAHGGVTHIVQDDQGFLWFGTQDGLQRYDGYGLREYPYDPRNPSGPSAPLTRAQLLKDRSGRLWIGSDYGLVDRYDPATEIFTHYSPDGGPFKGPIWTVKQDSGGAFWFATNQGLTRLDPATNRTLHYRQEPGDPGSLSSNSVRSTFEQKDGTFWVATAKGLDRFDPRTGKVVQRIPLPEGFPIVDPNPVLRVWFCEDHAGVLWVIFAHGYGLARVDRQAGALTFYSLDGTGQDNTLQAGARAIHEDEDGALWIGTTASGVLKLDRDRKRFVRYRNNPSNPDSLSADQINEIFEDREGNMWVATNGAGVNRFARRPLPFKSYRHEIGNPSSLDMDYTTAVYEDSRGLLWIGSMKALGRMDRQTGQIDFIRKSGGRGELSSTWIISIAEDRSGNLWFGTVGAGLNRLDRRTGKFKVYRHNPDDPHSLSHDTVTKMFVDRAGAVWAGTEDGLDLFDPATDSFRTYKLTAMADDNRMHDIAEDSEGAFWIATRSTGLLRFDPVTRQFTRYAHTADPASLSSDQANAVCVDHAGIVWVGTESGLNRFDLATRSITAYFQSDGLSGSNISKILEDERGDLWVSTSKGLSRFNPREKTFKNYYSPDGLAGNEFYNYASGSKSPSGEMFFNSYAGLTTFFPRDVVDNPYVPPVVITDFKISGNSVPIGGDSPLKQAISFTDTVTLSHTQNILSFEFSALSYTSPEGNRYRYRLEPLETKWNESVGNRRFITYSLAPGEYDFRVQGSNSRGTWNETGASVRIVILPPFWATRWFLASAVLAFLLSLVGAHYLRLQSVERKLNLRMEERVNERTRIARELHDTLLQGFHGLLLLFQAADNLLPERPVDAQKTLKSAIKRAGQAITEGRDAVQQLRSSKAITNDLAAAIATLGAELATGSSTSFHVEVAGGSRNLHPILRDEVYRIAAEALRNAFLHAQAHGIEVGIHYGEQELSIWIRDDGNGIDPEILKEGRTGHFGLRGMRERAELIGGRLDVWSKLGSGTEVDLSVPASMAYESARRRPFLGKWRKPS
ncbi:MAG TPA: two-component regulator propeller domain-containing protein [Bryobacteraceae bacterium]|nr:two-component regulator propeller domain-containing protein [Bryobacteraceae bacterium]